MLLASKIIAENLQKTGNFSSISYNDVSLYENFFKHEEASNYANNWAYITQACRNLGSLGYKYFTKESLLSLGYHNNHFVIVRPIGTNAVESIKSITKILYRVSGNPVYIKHLSEHQSTVLSKSNDFINMSNYPWEPECPFDDDTYPQVVIDLKNITGDSINKPENSKIRLRLNRFNNVFKSALRFIQYNPMKYPNQREIAFDIVSRCSKDPSAYENMIMYPAATNFAFLLFLDDKPVGFFTFGNIGNNEVGCFANICEYENYPALAETSLVKIFNLLYCQGIERVNLGGSEIESLHRFKIKLNAFELRNTSNIVYKPA